MGGIAREDGDTKGRYVLVTDAGTAAEMTYSKAGTSLIIIDHTEVPDGLRGQGVGAKLVTRAVEDAREGGYRILPLCPFAKKTFGDHPEWRDVL